jgi:hypothetical protein
MRRAMSAKAADRPVIPGGLHSILRELIATAAVATPSKRQSFEGMWKRLREVRFEIFPRDRSPFHHFPSDSATPETGGVFVAADKSPLRPFPWNFVFYTKLYNQFYA